MAAEWLPGIIDNDGDGDVVISNNNGPAQLYINQSESQTWIKVKPRGNSLGARVGLWFADGTTTWRRGHRDGSYLSSSEPAVYFGLAGGSALVSMEIIWPNGDARAIRATGPQHGFRGPEWRRCQAVAKPLADFVNPDFRLEFLFLMG